MIDEKKLIKEMERWATSNFSALDDKYEYRLEGMIKAQDIVLAQPQVGGWIPVSERLPSEYETVIGVTKYNYYCIAVYCKEYGFRSMDIGVEGDIIAWQPLPEPYKESEEE